jgi:hypothetical protein
LGRWVNRQRSLYQAGKLRKDRQLVCISWECTTVACRFGTDPVSSFVMGQALEKVGLKWSMLATTSWESMFDTLCDYVKTKVG